MLNYWGSNYCGWNYWGSNYWKWNYWGSNYWVSNALRIKCTEDGITESQFTEHQMQWGLNAQLLHTRVEFFLFHFFSRHLQSPRKVFPPFFFYQDVFLSNLLGRGTLYNIQHMPRIVIVIGMLRTQKFTYYIYKL